MNVSYSSGWRRCHKSPPFPFSQFLVTNSVKKLKKCTDEEERRCDKDGVNFQEIIKKNRRRKEKFLITLGAKKIVSQIKTSLTQVLFSSKFGYFFV